MERRSRNTLSSSSSSSHSEMPALPRWLIVIDVSLLSYCLSPDSRDGILASGK